MFVAIGLSSTVVGVAIALTQPLSASVWALALLPAAAAVWWGWARRLRRMERVVHDGEARKSRLLDAAPDAVISIRPSGEIVEFNSAAERAFGLTRQHAVGRSFVELANGGRRRRQLAQGLRRFIASKRTKLVRIQFKVQRIDGTTIPAELTIVQNDYAGDVLVTGFLRDLSPRMQVERELRESEARYRSLI